MTEKSHHHFLLAVPKDDVPRGVEPEAKLPALCLPQQIHAQLIQTLERTLGNNDFQQKAEITMYPNPTSDFITLNNLESSNYNVTIFDVSGKAVQSNKNCNVSDSGTLTVPVSGLSKGIYMVNIATGNSSWTKQLIVN